MEEQEYFLKTVTIDINAATIGINRKDWYCHRPGMTKDEVIETMISKKYDVVPIINKSGNIKWYFTMNQQGALLTNKIVPQIKLYYLTSIRDVIWKLNQTRNTHFFLTNGRDNDDILGLFSLSNFNCREFYIFLFSLLCRIEREFSNIIEYERIKAFEILEKLSNTIELKRQLDEIKARFENDLRNNNENDYKEYLYLHHLIWLIKEAKQYKQLGYSNSEKYMDGVGKLKALRNIIAHPVKSIVSNIDELVELEKSINKLYEFKERLENKAKHEINNDGW